MKRTYNLLRLAAETGFDPVQVEKVCRISDILEDISAITFMRKRLSLYGGTALAFIHFNDIERLSVDIDFNYRHIDRDKDWGDVRDEIDRNLKIILHNQRYTDDAIKITPRYPLSRFTIKYTNHVGLPDEIMIETGYMRRIPMLQSDLEHDFYHLGTAKKFKMMTPQKEELFGNKWCTMLYRSSPRDLFDVYRISQDKFDLDRFRLTAIIDSLMRGKSRIVDIDIERTVRAIRFDSPLMNVLSSGSAYDQSEVHERVIGFSNRVIESITPEERRLLEEFYGKKRFDIDLLPTKNMLHDDIENHPMIERILEKLI
ncbi:MAG: nucleotidyl transferase AbiEii/AbiGii toxin family protein [Candidatus Bathyarchaeota archaeon]|nr:nucleotidyl transferase AbiEii/AbiGii toxin family protein [Candidatus Bathyarchaeota archaeon]